MIVFVLRHADRTIGDDLKPEGTQRAKLLARMLAESPVTVAFRSQYIRAKKTLQPLEALLGGTLRVEKIVYDPKTEGADYYAQRIAKLVRDLSPDAVAVVVGHTDTVPKTIEKLGGPVMNDLGEDEFDRLFVLFIDAGRTTTLMLRYGEPTPP